MKIYSICRPDKWQVYDFHLNQWITITPEDDDVVNNHIMTAGEFNIALSRLVTRGDSEMIEVLEYPVIKPWYIQDYTAAEILHNRKEKRL